MSRSLEEAKKLLVQGLSVIPICSAIKNDSNSGKNPAIKEIISFQSRRATDEEIESWFQEEKNLAIYCGKISGNRCVLDFDGENWDFQLEMFIKVFPEFENTLWVVTGSGRCHLHFICPDLPEDVTKKVRTFPPEGSKNAIELRCNGHLTMMPPSNHWSGGCYKYENDGNTPITISGERLHEIVKWLDEGKDKACFSEPCTNEKDFSEIDSLLTDEDRELLAESYVTYFSKKVNEDANGRNDMCYQLGRELHNLGLSLEQAEPFLKLYHDAIPYEIMKEGVLDKFKYDSAKATLKSAYNNPRSLPWRIKWILRKDDDKWSRRTYVSSENETKLLNFNLTEAGNAESFKMIHGGEFCFIKEEKEWFKFDGVKWEEAEEEVRRLFVDLMRQKRIIANKTLEGNKDAITSHTKWGLSSELDSRVNHSLHMAQSYMTIKRDMFDVNQFLFGCANGVVDLYSGNFREARARDYLLKSTRVPYDPKAECPRWLQFLEEIFEGKKSLIQFIQKAVGYSMTGSCIERAFFILYGTGSNGKSVFLNTLFQLFGDYGQAVPMSAFKDTEQPGSTVPEIVRLKGIRFGKSVEIKEQTRLNVERVKSMTGDDVISGRTLYEKNLVEFNATFKLWLAVNHLPIITDTTNSIWDRMKSIPFNARFTTVEDVKEGDKIKDLNLGTKLRSELSGILKWAIEGCLLWQKENLGDPCEVKDLRNHYREEQDIVGRFLEEKVEKVKGEQAPIGPMYSAFIQWAMNAGEMARISQKDFVKRILEKGYKKSDKRIFDTRTKELNVVFFDLKLK